MNICVRGDDGIEGGEIGGDSTVPCRRPPPWYQRHMGTFCAPLEGR